MPAATRDIAHKRPLRVYIVDDNADAVMTLAILLRDEGYDVHTSANPNIALDAIRREKPDVCIFDIKMPGKSGYELAREVLAAGLVPAPVLVATSGHYKKAPEQLMARAVGFRHFLPKGSDPTELLAVLRELAPSDEPPLAAWDLVRVYGIKNCDTMKKAFAWLDSHKVAYEFHDYKKEGVPPGKLAAWAKRVGWDKLANMRGPTWRKIEKPSVVDERSALRLLEENSSAIRRPIVEAGDRLLIGFDPAEFEKLR